MVDYGDNALHARRGSHSVGDMKYTGKANPKPSTKLSAEAKARNARRVKIAEIVNTFGVYGGLVIGIVGAKMLQQYKYGATQWGDLAIPNSLDIVVTFISSVSMVAGFERTKGSDEAKKMAKLGKQKNVWRRFTFAVAIGAGTQGTIGVVI